MKLEFGLKIRVKRINIQTRNFLNYLDFSKYTVGQTLSKLPNRYPSNYPKVIEYGKDGHVFSEGKEYVDLISGLGCISVGYNDDEVNIAIQKQMLKGISFSLPHRLEYEAAKKLTELVPWTEQWKFGKTGTDGVLMAIRAARAFTGRKKILTIGYHGCTDHFECLGIRRAGMIDMSEYTKDLRKHSIDNETAAIIIEPDCGIDLDWIKWECVKYKTLFILDEVVTGGRYKEFTASSYNQIVPDLIVLGKGLANGLPLCAVGGNREIMSTFERDDFFASGTFNGETLSLAAFMATQDILTKSIDQMIRYGYEIKNYFNTLNFPAECIGYPTRLYFKFKKDIQKYLFWQEMCKHGILLGYTNFLMANHTNNDVDKICKVITEVSKELEGKWDKAEELLEKPHPISAVRN